MKTYLITGGAGFIGSSLSERLIKEGNRVVAIDNFCDFYNPTIKENNVKELIKNSNFKLYRNDIRDSKILSNVRRLMRSECDSKLLIPTIKYLENEGLLSRSEFALALMQYVYDERIDLDKSNFKFKINRLEGAFWHNYVLYNPDVAQILMQGANLDENRKYEMAKG